MPAPTRDDARHGLQMRIALLPLLNLSGGAVPVRELQASLESALRRRGLALASSGAVDEFLARHRLRYTGGVDPNTARVARDDLGVDALLLAAVTLHGSVGGLRFGMIMRLVSAAEPPRILWMDEVARTGDDAPGLFDLGVVRSMKELVDREMARLAASLTAALSGEGPAIGTCPPARRFRPRFQRALPVPASGGRIRVAVVPFVNPTARLDAGEILSLEFVRELARRERFDVVEPGVVRAELLRNRVVMEGGVTHEAARVALGALEADVVLAGYVRGHDEGAPYLEFTVLALDARDNRVVWRSSSHNAGDDSVWLLGLGRASTSQRLACRMVRSVVDEMEEAWSQASQRKGKE